MAEKTVEPSKSMNLLGLSLLAVLIGVVAGLGAVVFRGLIALFHNILFLGKFSVIYDANSHTPLGPWGPLIILVPVVGAFGVAFLVKNFAPEAKGHGVPEVMDAIYYNNGVIRPIVAVIKSVASALSIGSGGAIGREGPIIQIGASFGSTMGQVLKMSTWQRITLIAGGAGGGIAATFNTPVGGILFAVEIMLHEVSVRTLVPVAISTATATYVGRLVFGPHPSFMIPNFQQTYFNLTNPWVLLLYVGLGILMGVVSALYIKSIYGFEDFFEHKIKGNYYTRHMLGMLVVGVLMYVMMVAFGHYYIQGVGYAAVQDILTNNLSAIFLLLLLFVLKLLTVSLTLGSGASGGIFSPGLFMGATLGGAYGILLQNIFPGLNINPAAFAVAGMAGAIGGSTGAAMAGIVMIFEMTMDYRVIIPMTVTVALADGVRRMLSNETIYTLKLVRRKHSMPEALQANFYQMKQASLIMNASFQLVEESLTVSEFWSVLKENPNVSNFILQDSRGEVSGVVTNDVALRTFRDAHDNTPILDLAVVDYFTAQEETKLFHIISGMASTSSHIALIVDKQGESSAENVRGIITKEQVTQTMEQSFQIFSD